MRAVRSLQIVALTTCLLTSTALAQEIPTYVVGGWVGVYLPTSDLVSDQIIDQPGSGISSTVSFRQGTSLGLGARGSRALTPKLAVELELFWADSRIELSAFRTGVDRTETTADAHVFAANVAAVYEVFRAPFTPLAIHLSGGLGLVNRGGAFYETGGDFLGPIAGGTDIAFVLGGGFRYGISSKVGLRLDVRDYISSYRQSLPDGQELDSQLQNDFVISLGAEYGFGQ